ncbi:MAG: hypothetical protein HOO86_05345 [Bacteroidales bacterium]|nr:hypothetical protein [Bacteroidales bacterium]
MLFKKSIGIGLVCLGFIIPAQAQLIEKTKSYNKTFPVSKTTELTVTNKYGNIHLMQWPKDSVKFEVQVRVADLKDYRVEKLFNEIDVDFNHSPYYVNATTTFAGSNKLWSELSDMTKSVMNSGSATTINYTIYLPDYIRVNIDNRFGNIYTTDHKNNSEFHLSNGTLQANDLHGKCSIKIEFGNVNINYIEEGRIELNYSEIDLATGKNINLIGRSSTAQLGDIEQLNLDSRRDKITVNTVKSITGETSFSRLTVNHLQTDFMVKSEYGTIQFMKMSPEIKYLQLNAAYTVTNLYANPSINADVEATFSKKTKIVYPPAMINIERQQINLQEDTNLFKGRLGNGNAGEFKFNLTGGELNIYMKP